MKYTLLNSLTRSLSISTLASIALLGGANAAVVASWDLSDGSVTTNAAATGLDAGTASAGAGLSSANFTANGFGGDENAGLLDSSPGLGSVITDGQYLAFSVTPGSLGITNLTFDLTIETLARASNTVTLMSSVDGFTLGNQIDTYTNSTANSTANVSFDVSSFSSETSPIEFRLYLYGKETSPNAGSATYISNLSLSGNVVPEPTALTLLGLGSLACLTRRKR